MDVKKILDEQFIGEGWSLQGKLDLLCDWIYNTPENLRTNDNLEDFISGCAYDEQYMDS